MMLTNGYHNSASFDRIENNIGYSNENIEIRPLFLNTPCKLTTQMLKDIIDLREKEQSEQVLTNIVKHLNKYNYTNFFYKIANNAKSHCITNRKTFEFNSIYECGLFLIQKYIDQGGRCHYSNVPIYPESHHPYRLSLERLNPMKGYSPNNIILIVIGLNGGVYGQFLNKNLTEDERLRSSKNGKFN